MRICSEKLVAGVTVVLLLAWMGVVNEVLSFLSQSNSHSKVCATDLCETIIEALNSRLDLDYTFAFYFVTIRSKTWSLFKSHAYRNLTCKKNTAG